MTERVGQRRPNLSRSVDYLDILANTLRDLGGATTIPHELIQNADDSGDATTVRFEITDEALTAWNDGTFTDCRNDIDDCEQDPPCDLHAFRKLMGRTKENDAATTGAFGVGFTSVYRISDCPELLYDNEHWYIDESAAEAERLRSCGGNCGRRHHEPGTTFVLPWARKPSQLRTKLEVPPVSTTDIRELEDGLLSHASEMLLFLHHVRQIEVITEARVYSVERRDMDGGRRIVDDETEREWLLLFGDFADDAAVLKEQYPGLIKTDRPQTITIALALDGSVTAGRLFATLPTQSSSGLPGHIDSSFFPTTDRKAVVFETDPRSRWNQAAMVAAARGLEVAASKLIDALGVSRFWELLGAITDLTKQQDAGPTSHAHLFHEALISVVPDLPALDAILERRVSPRGAVLPRETRLYEASPALAAIDLPMVVQAQHQRLSHNNVYLDYGVTLLTGRELVAQLQRSGHTLTFTPSQDDLTLEHVRQLLQALNAVQGKASNIDGVGRVAIIPCRGGEVAPASEVLWPDSDDDASLFELIDDRLHLVDTAMIEDLCPDLEEACPHLDVPAAASILRDANPNLLRRHGRAILTWLQHHSDELTPDAKREIASAPLFLSSDGQTLPLTELSLPKGFPDELGVAAVVADGIAQDYHKLLIDLGARPLDLATYLTDHVIPAATRGRIDPAKGRQLLAVVAAHMHELGDLHQHLSEAPIVPCTDGLLHAGPDVHLPSADLGILAPDFPVADILGISPAVLEWLGVANAPSDRALGAAATRLSANDVADHETAEVILRTIAERPSKAEPPMDLTIIAWLPLKRGGLAKPSDVLPTNQNYLYGSQGPELGLSASVQAAYYSQLVALGMPRTVPLDFVVTHFNHCAQTGERLNPQVYATLSQNADERIVRQLAGAPLIQIASGRWVQTRTAFWSTQPFGRWATVLPDDWNQYRAFFDLVGVKAEPGPDEIAAVLESIRQEFTTDRVDDEARAAVRGCWSLLSRQLEGRELQLSAKLAELGVRGSALDARGVMSRPDRLLFEDARGFYRKFRLLSQCVISREVDTLPALTAAGVGRAETQIKAEIEEVTAKIDSHFTTMLADRLGAFRRVVDDPDAVDRLRQIETRQTDRLNVTFRAEVFGQVERLKADTAEAIYLDERDVLYLKSGASTLAIARELARAIDIDRDPGPLAMQLDHILRATSNAEANATLDEFGIHRLDVTAYDPVWSNTAEQGLDAGDLDRDGSSAARDEVQDDSSEAAASEWGVDESELGTTTGSGRGEATQRTRERSARAGRSDRRGGTYRRMRSYVSTRDDADELDHYGDEAPDYSEIDMAGIARVLEFERSCGRAPIEMGHTNPGYDVESSRDGEIVRRIEVKSTGDAWSPRGVMLSRRQQEQATEDGELFWLYIVENATSKDFVIYRIQDPANRIDYFGFDDGWKAIGEPDVERDASGAPTARSTLGLLGSTFKE